MRRLCSLMARDRGEFLPRRQILIYPATYNDHTEHSFFDSVRENGTDYLLTSKRVCDYMDLYKSSDEDLHNPYFAPLLAKSLADQPDTLVITAEYDPLRDEGEEYARKLRKFGNQVQLHRVADGLHGFFSLPPSFPQVKECYEIINRFFERGAARVKAKKSADWRRLDNAAKIFPCTSTKADTKVFRFSCELTEPVDQPTLQLALERALEVFPGYRCSLRRGMFWYYLEDSTEQPIVREEYRPPCSALYEKGSRGLLFEVTYFRRRINFEVYHALTDGTGRCSFARIGLSLSDNPARGPLCGRAARAGLRCVRHREDGRQLPQILHAQTQAA